jgi:hypothetical protein
MSIFEIVESSRVTVGGSSPGDIANGSTSSKIVATLFLPRVS